MQHSTQRDGHGLKGLLNDVSTARGPWRRGNTGRSMSFGSGLVSREATHLEIGDYRLVKTLGVGAFGKVQRELAMYPPPLQAATSKLNLLVSLQKYPCLSRWLV